MDPAQEAELKAIGQLAGDLIEEVEAALDEYAEHSVEIAARRKVDDLARRYREVTSGLTEMEKLEVDRTIGRKLRDVQKMAAPLPTAPEGAPASKIADDSFFATREGKSSRQPIKPGEGALPRGQAAPKFKVTGEVEAWCGACGDLKTHVIVAMMGDQPAQVVCQVCGGRHKFRTGPARPRPQAAAPEVRRAPPPDPAQQKRDRERAALIDTLRNAETVRPYSPKERYRTGEILEHPEHGRGKIENILPRSMLVRFAGGLKTVKLG